MRNHGKDNQDGSRLHRSTPIGVRDSVYKTATWNHYSVGIRTIEDKTTLKQRLQCILMALMLIIGTQAAAETPTPTLKGAYIEFPPLSYTNDSGKPAGSYIKRVNELAERAGYRIRWQSLPIDRIYLYLREGDIDFWLGSSGVPELADWTREPDFTFPPIRLKAYFTDDTPAIAGKDDLRGESLILIRGYTYLDRLAPVTDAPRTGVGKAPDHKAGLRMLKARRGDYLLDFQKPVENALEKEPLPAINEHLLMQWDTGLVFSRQTDNLDRIIRDFEAAWRARDDDWTSTVTPETSQESPTQASGAHSRSPGGGDTPRGSTTGPG